MGTLIRYGYTRRAGKVLALKRKQSNESSGYQLQHSPPLLHSFIWLAFHDQYRFILKWLCVVHSLNVSLSFIPCVK